MSLWRQPGARVVVATLMVAFLLDHLPLPEWLARINPDWLALVLIYWCLALPQRVGIGTGWVLGLLVDAAHGTLLGQHALVYAVLAFLALKSHHQVRAFPVWQQAVSVVSFLLVGRLLLFWINGMIGYPPRGWAFLIPLGSALLVWPILFVLLRDLGRRYRLN